MKICIVKTDRMGDMILTLPVIDAITRDKTYKVDVVSSEKNYKICRQFKDISKTYIYKSGLSNFVKLLITLRKEKYDFIYNFSPYWSSFILCCLSYSTSKSTIIHLSRNKKIFSKINFRILASIFFNKKYVIDRLKSFDKNINFHQTNVMYNTIKSDLVNIKALNKVEFFFKSQLNLSYLKNTILIHLTARWLHQRYSEEDLISLIKKLIEKKLKIILTTDESTKDKFPKLFKIYKTISHDCIEEEVFKNEVFILDNLNLIELAELVNNIDIVLTPECGLLHIAGMCGCKLIVIYNGHYYPKMMMAEYSPWEKEYFQLISTEDNLNNKILNLI